jgi:hypothetical protein
MFKQTNDPIYKHTHVDPNMVKKFTPLFESTFKTELGAYTGARSAIGKEKIAFLASQYANRVRVSEVAGEKPLFEDAKIFGNLGQLKNLFESVSTPSNIIGMGNVANSGSPMDGGMWNPNYQAGSGDIPSYVFGLQSHIALHCVGFDLLPTIPVDTPKVVINFIDTVYGGGSLDDANNQADYLEFASPTFTRAFIKDKDLVRGVSLVTLVTSTATKNGTAQPAIQCRFVVGSTVTASLTMEVLATGTFNETTNVFVATNDISVKSVTDTMTGIGATGGSYSIDGGVTVLVGAKVTPKYASATRTNIIEASTNNNSRSGMRRAQMEKGATHKLNVISLDKTLEMVGLEIDADTSNIQIKDMAAQGVNVIARLYNGVQNQLVQSLDEVIMDRLYALGVEHAKGAFASQDINHSLYIDAPANATKSMTSILNGAPFVDMLGNDVSVLMGNVTNSLVSASYENQATHADRLYSRILLISEFVGQQNRIGCPDFIVVGGEIASCLKKNSKYAVNPTQNTLLQSPELAYNGTLYDTINVYKNPRIDFNDPRILMGRRGNDTDPGCKFLAYDLASSRQAIVEGTMAEKIRVWSRFALAEVGFFPELNYYTAVAYNGFKWA